MAFSMILRTTIGNCIKRPHVVPNIMPIPTILCGFGMIVVMLLLLLYVNYLNYNPIFSCPHVQRVGGVGDGAKWTCDPHRLRQKWQQPDEKDE